MGDVVLVAAVGVLREGIAHGHAEEGEDARGAERRLDDARGGPGRDGERLDERALQAVGIYRDAQSYDRGGGAAPDVMPTASPSAESNVPPTLSPTICTLPPGLAPKRVKAGRAVRRRDGCTASGGLVEHRCDRIERHARMRERRGHGLAAVDGKRDGSRGRSHRDRTRASSGAKRGLSVVRSRSCPA